MKMEKILFFTLLIFQSINFNGQSWDWAVGDGSDSGVGISTDANGNIYVASTRCNSTYINYPLTCLATGEVIAKHDPSGAVIWAKKIIAGNIAGISVDKIGNSFITGSCNSATFCSTNGNIIITHPGDYQAFVSKYDVNGNVLWVKTWGYANSGDGGKVIKTDLNGNSYVAGQSLKSPYQGGALSNFFLLKYDTQGNLLWSKTSNWRGNMGAGGIDIDQNENLYLSGSFSDSAFFDNIILNTTTYSSVFIAKYDKNGNVLWAKKDGTSYDSGAGIALDNKGNFYLTGFHGANSSYGGINLTPKGMLLVKYDTTGTVLWAKNAGQSAPGIMVGVSVGCDPEGGCFITGWMHGIATFPGGINPVTLTSLKDPELFVAKYNSLGALQWAIMPGGGPSLAPGYGNGPAALATDNNGNCFITGGYSPITIFGSSTLTNGGMFLAKIKQNPVIIPDTNLVAVGLQTQTLAENEFMVHPNPTSNFVFISFQSVEEIKKLELKITNVIGQCFYNRSYESINTFNEDIDLSKYARGIYFIEIVADKRRKVKKLILD
jgi:hypothetical protein